MHDVRNRNSGRRRPGTKHGSPNPDSGLIRSKSAPGTADAKRSIAPRAIPPPIGTEPRATVRAAAFPADIRVPPHRGASIRPAPVGPLAVPLTPVLMRPAAAPGAATPGRRKSAPEALDQPPGASAPGPAPKVAGASGSTKTKARTRKSEPVRAKKPRKIRAAAAPHPVPALPLPPVEEVLVLPVAQVPPRVSAPAAVAPPSGAAPAVPRHRALVRTETGLVARVVAWLGGLMPRKRRAALPRARTRIERSGAQPVIPPAANGPEPVKTPATAGVPELETEVQRRMLLQLSAENERLRREIAQLRAGQDQRAQV